MRRVAVVTGANQGIGLAIVKLLCQRFQGDVILTARSEEKGQGALNELVACGLRPLFHVLDVTSKESVLKLRKHLEDTYGGLDILVNNAAISFRVLIEDMSNRKEEISAEEIKQNVKLIAEDTLKTNFFSLVDVCDILYSILRDGARVVNLASRGSRRILLGMPPRLRHRAMTKDIPKEDIITLMQEFVDSCGDGTYSEKGWPNNAYGVSKLGVVLLTAAYQKMMDPCGKRNIVVNSCCPGLVKTYMSDYRGVTPEEGADTPVYLALLPQDTDIKGSFIADRKFVDLYTFDTAEMSKHVVLKDVPSK